MTTHTPSAQVPSGVHAARSIAAVVGHAALLVGPVGAVMGSIAWLLNPWPLVWLTAVLAWGVAEARWSRGATRVTGSERIRGVGAAEQYAGDVNNVHGSNKPPRLATAPSRAHRSDRALPVLAGVTVLAIMWAALYGLAVDVAAESAGQRTADSALRYAIALGALFIGVALRGASYRALGANYVHEVALREQHELCEDGIFALLRHPSEAGLRVIGIAALLCTAGTPAVGNPAVGIAAGLYVVLVGLITLRVRREDELLAVRFGDAFKRYRKRVL